MSKFSRAGKGQNSSTTASAAGSKSTRLRTLYFAGINFTVMIIIPVANDKLQLLRDSSEKHSQQLRTSHRMGALETNQTGDVDEFVSSEKDNASVDPLGRPPPEQQQQQQQLSSSDDREDVVLFHPLSPTTPDSWPHRIVLTLTVGYGPSNLTILIRSFEKNVRAAAMVVFSDGPEPSGFRRFPNVFWQQFRSPTSGEFSGLKFWTLRFVLYSIFLQQMNFPESTQIILTDAHDVAFLANPFKAVPENAIHFFQESSRYPVLGSKHLSHNHQWMNDCYGDRIAFAYGDKPVINSGFIMGHVAHICSFLDDFKVELERLPRSCFNIWGCDQAITNHIVRSGRVSINAPLVLHTNDDGPVLNRFSTKAVYKQRRDGGLVSSVGEKSIAVLHGYNRFNDTQQLVYKMFGKLQ
eukprot:TRINITY_DN7246_c2_g1_i1.p1 TRINITY_DN7246_c2_g1~~TRINITY_DN7246_c2_g1_i1.p1  ORF type:complete len:409 (-),score=78.30 TRINITY_DN7246_c2_g1_i1:204-1430(-)